MTQQQMKEGDTFTPNNWDDAHPGRFLKSVHLGGKELTLTITKVWVEHMGMKVDKKTGIKTPDLKNMLAFKEDERHYSLQKTNEIVLAEMFDITNPALLVGKRVTFKPDTDKFGNDTVGAIRIAGSPDIAGDMTIVVRYAEKTRRPSKTFHVRRTQVPGGPVKQSQQDDDGATPEQLESALSRIAAAIDAQALDELSAMYKPVQWSKGQRAQVGQAFAARRASVSGGDNV